jgi:hypothetical protein
MECPARRPYDPGVSDPERGSRERWPVRKYRLGHEPPDDLSDSTTPEERLAMMWPLTLEAWALTGREIPAYDRHSTPVHKVRREA